MSKNKRYTDEEFINAVKSSISIREALIKLGLKGSGGNYSLAKRRIKDLNIDISHLLGNGYLKGQHHNWAKKRDLKDILIQNSPCCGSSKIKKRLFKEGLLENKCYKCGLTTWLEQPIPLELEHINGDGSDNRIENLIILCPNCHSQTPTYRRRKSSFDEKKKIYCKNCNKEISKYSKSGLCIKCARVYRSPNRSPKSENFCINCNALINKKSKLCVKCMILKNRKVKDRPSKEQLLKEIEETNYCAVGRKYGVTDNAIRKWLK